MCIGLSHDAECDERRVEREDHEAVPPLEPLVRRERTRDGHEQDRERQRKL